MFVICLFQVAATSIKLGFCKSKSKVIQLSRRDQKVCITKGFELTRQLKGVERRTPPEVSFVQVEKYETSCCVSDLRAYDNNLLGEIHPEGEEAWRKSRYFQQNKLTRTFDLEYDRHVCP